MEGSPSLPRPLRFDFDFWLRRCEGFSVEAPQGRVGVVEYLRFASRPDRPDALVVRAGRFAAQPLLVPVEEVADIVPRQGRVVLRHDPRPASLLARLGHVRADRHRSGEPSAGEAAHSPAVAGPLLAAELLTDLFAACKRAV